MAKHKFVDHIFVAYHDDGDDKWYNANQDANAVVEEDGPTRVATYKLVEVNSLAKRIVSQREK